MRSSFHSAERGQEPDLVECRGGQALGFVDDHDRARLHGPDRQQKPFQRFEEL